MADYYELNPFKRRVSIIAAPVDGYTCGLAAGKDVRVLINTIGRIAIAKNDGYHVFTDIPPGLWELEILSGEYFYTRTSVDTRQQSTPPVVRVRLIPNGNYKLPANAAFLDCTCEKGTRVFAIPICKTTSAKLRELTESEISVRAAANTDLSYQLLSFYEGGEMDVFETGEKTGKNTYRHNGGLEKQYGAGALIYPVSEGMADDNGRLFCPVRGIDGEPVLVKFEEAKNVYYKRFAISGGKGGCLTPEE